MYTFENPDPMSPVARVVPFDIGEADPNERRSRAVLAYRALAVGAVMQLVDSQDPIDLYSALHAVAPGDFSWLYLEHGPGSWTVKVQKLGRIYSAGECCGVCGGGKPKSTNPTRSNP